MNERLVMLRKTLKLTQIEMGSALGVTPAAISRLESGDRNLTEQMLLAISRTYDVNIDWLRNGIGEMFIEPEEISLDDYAKKNQISAFETEVIKGYLSLSKETRNEFMEILRAASKVTEGKKVLSVVKKEALSAVAEQQSTYAAHNDAEIDDEEIKLMKQDLDEL